MKTLYLVLFMLCVAFGVHAQEYSSGYYYDLSGQKIAGLIKFSPTSDYLHYKADKKASSQKVKIKEIKAVVMNYGGLRGTDSLTVMTEDNKDNKQYFAEYQLSTPVTRFYTKFIATSGGGVATMTSTSIPGSHYTINTWSRSRAYYGTIQVTMYQDGNTTYELTKKNFIDVLSKAFADVPDLAQQIQANKFKFKQLDEMFGWYQNKTNYKQPSTTN